MKINAEMAFSGDIDPIDAETGERLRYVYEVDTEKSIVREYDGSPRKLVTRSRRVKLRIKDGTSELVRKEIFRLYGVT